MEDNKYITYKETVWEKGSVEGSIQPKPVSNWGVPSGTKPPFEITGPANAVTYQYETPVSNPQTFYPIGLLVSVDLGETTATIVSYGTGTVTFSNTLSTTALSSRDIQINQGNITENALAKYSICEGLNTETGGSRTSGKGYPSSINHLTTGQASHAEGCGSVAVGSASHAEGYDTFAGGNNGLESCDANHAEGASSKVFGFAGHVEGGSTVIGSTTNNQIDYSHAEGFQTKIDGNVSSCHAEGDNTYISGQSSVSACHVEGSNTHIGGSGNVGVHVEGVGSYLNNDGCNGSHVEGYNSKINTTTMSYGAHVEGYGAEVQTALMSPNGTHVEGFSTIGKGYYGSHTEGAYNYVISSSDDEKLAMHVVGIGDGNSSRKNAHVILKNGDTYIYGIGGYDGTGVESANTLQQCVANVAKIIPLDKSQYDQLSVKEYNSLYCVDVSFRGVGLGNGTFVNGDVPMPAETYYYHDSSYVYFTPYSTLGSKKWKIHNIDFWDKVINGGGGRVGSKVNNRNSCYYSVVQISDSLVTGGICNGLLLFPDNFTISGKTLTYTNRSNLNVGFTEQDLSVYLNQGCIFMPALGYRDGSTLVDYGIKGYYMCSDTLGSNQVACLYFGGDSVGITNFSTTQRQYTAWGFTTNMAKQKYRYFKGNKEITFKNAVNEVKHLLGVKPKIKKFGNYLSISHPLFNFGGAEIVLLRYNRRYRKGKNGIYEDPKKGYSILQGMRTGWNAEYFSIVGRGQDTENNTANFNMDELYDFLADISTSTLTGCMAHTYGFALRIPNPDYEGFPTGNKNNIYQGQCESLWSDIQRIALRYDDEFDHLGIGII